tara:strand:+ start:1015 stop:1134 length:120 start_codon:yes stop_codon:yes gene_type:complete
MTLGLFATASQFATELHIRMEDLHAESYFAADKASAHFQ